MKKFHILTSVVTLISLIFIARLAYLQIFSDRYLLNGFHTSVKKEYEIPKRGFILDRNGKMLVTNSPSYQIEVTEDLITPDFDTLSFCNLLGIPVSEFKERMNVLHRQPTFDKNKQAVFMKNVNPEDAATYSERMYRFKAFKIQNNPDRKYLTNFGGNILGYINEVSPREMKKDSTYYVNGDKIGKAGVEKSYEKILRGEKGIKWVQKDINQKSIGSYKGGKYDQVQAAGKDLKLTIDFELQELAEHMLQNKRGAIVALDPKTGEILCLASTPSYSPNEISGKYKQENLYRLLNDSFQKPMYDRALQAAYPPGSTFKMLTGLAAMQMGVIDTGTAIVCHGGFRIGRRWVNCHDYGAHRLENAIRLSCNTYFSRSYARMIEKDSTDYTKGLQEWVDIMHSFGLGEYFGNDLPVGNKGNIPDTAYYRRAFGKDHIRPYSIFSNGIGQGEVLLTPLQMASSTAAIVNEGFFYTPHIVKEIDGKPIEDENFTKPKITKVDPKYFQFVKRGMERVILSGTARNIRTRAFTQMGKTGTAQNPNRDHSLFVLAAPADDPTIVVAVVVENGGFGAKFAAPMASVIAEKYVLGEVKRDYLVKRMASQSLQYEYRRQWVNYLKKEGKWIDYVDPAAMDSMNLDPVNIAMIKEAIRQRKIEEERRRIKDSLARLEKDSVR